MAFDPVLDEIVRKYEIRARYYLIIAPNHRWGLYHIRRLGIPRQDCVIVTHPEKIYGYQLDWEVVVTGGAGPGTAKVLKMMEAFGMKVHWDGELDS